MNFVIRSAAREDANVIGDLSRELRNYLRGLGDPSILSFDTEAYLRDGFGPNPAFSGLVAEADTMSSRGRVLLCARLASCWRSATFSIASSVRVDDSARSRRKRTVKTAIVALMTPGS